MRVLVLSHQFPNDYEPQAGTYVLEQIRALRDIGVDSVVMSPTPWVPPFLRKKERLQKYVSMPVRAVVDNFEVTYPRVLTLPRNHLFALSGLLFYLSCRQRLRRVLRSTQIDLIHAHTIMPDGFAAVLLGREFNLPVVCTIHGSDVTVYPAQGRWIYRATRWALSNADHLIAVSQHLKNRILEIAGQCDVVVIHNGADAHKFAPIAKQRARQLLGLPAENKILLFVGNLLEVKGVSLLLQAVRHLSLPDLSLYVVGSGDLNKRLMKEANDADLRSCSFVGSQPHDRIPLWLSAADCIVLPSLSEGLPTILCEAMHCKTPIVATDVGGVPEIIKDHSTGLLVPSGDTKALTAAIAEQFANSSLACAMAEHAHRSAKQNLTWQANVSKVMPVYEGALALQSAPTANTKAACSSPQRI